MIRWGLVLLLGLGLAVCAQAAEKRALLIGINHYQMPDCDLRGCENDVLMTRDLLVAKFGFPQENVEVLLNSQATAQNIRRAVEEWLIAPVKPEDIVYFHYSGHGSQTADLNGDEEDGLDELICPANMYPGDISTVITDDQLQELFARIPARNVTIVLDACHSGTGTRDLSLCRPRFVQFEPGTRGVAPPSAPGRPPSRDKLQGSGGIDGGGRQQVIISGCRPEQTSADAWIRDGFYAGALSYYLVENMEKAPPDITFRELLERVARDLQANNYTQVPQIEGAVDRALAGVVGEAAPQALPVAAPSQADALRLRLEAGDPRVAEAVQVSLGALGFVEVVDSTRHFDHRLRISSSPDSLQAALTTDGVPGPLVAGVDADALVRGLRPQLENAGALKALAGLDNPNPPFRIEVWANRAQDEVALEQAGDEKLVQARVGDVLRFNFRAEQDCYLTLVDLGTSGKVTVLFPNKYQPDGLVRGGKVYRTGTPGEMPFRIRARGPAGRELVKVIATTEPLNLASLQMGQVGAEGTRGVESGSRFAGVLLRDLAPLGPAAGNALPPARGWATDYLIVETAPAP